MSLMTELRDFALKDSSSVEINRYLPDDLVIQILSRLPAKSLGRYLCVSKLWSSLIYKLRILHPMSCLFIPSNQRHIRELVTPEPQLKHHVICRNVHDKAVIHSCNGLLLLYVYGSPTEYYVYKVATRQYAHIDVSKTNFCEFGTWHYEPELFQKSSDFYSTQCFLAYDPCKSPHYNVVRFTSEDNSILVQIYSSMRQSWAERTLLQRSAHLSTKYWVEMAAFHKGALYIVTSYDPDYFPYYTDEERFDDHLIRFDIDKVNFDLIKLPCKKHICTREFCLEKPYLRRRGRCLASCIGVSRGNLYFGVHCCPLNQLHIYVLDEHDLKWRFVHNTTNQKLNYSRFDNDYHPIAFHPESEVIYLASHGIISYDYKTSRVEKLLEFDVPEDVDEVFSTDVYPVIRYLEPIDDFHSLSRACK